MSEKAIRNELKQPDSFQRVGGEARDWLADRQKWVAGAVVVVLVVGLGLSISHYLSDRREAKAAVGLGEALEPLSRPVAADGQELPGLQGAKPSFKSDTEKDEALIQSLGRFRDQNPKSEAAKGATLAQAQAEYRLGRYEPALQGFDLFLKDADSNDPLRANALEGRGYALEALGRTDEALKAFEALAQATTGDYLKGMGLYHQGRILAAAGKKAEAAKRFAQIHVEAPGSAAARIGKERLALLAAEGVAVPVSPPVPVLPSTAPASGPK